MALRRQLLLMASLTLALPWAGREYVREMEVRVREGQQGALLATAQAVAARIGADDELIESLKERLAANNADAYYAHPLPTPVVVDGYSEEWRAFGFVEQVIDSSLQVGVSWGTRDGVLYGLVKVADSERQFYDPAQPISASDHLRLSLGSRVVRLFTAAPG